MVTWSSNNKEIVAHVDAFDILGFDPPIDNNGANSLYWVRCYINFSNLRGEEVIDVPVICDISENESWFFSDRHLHVSIIDDDKIISIIKNKVSLIRSKDESAIFSKLEEIGFGDSEIK